MGWHIILILIFTLTGLQNGWGFPSLRGKMVFHRYSNLDAWDGKLFLFNFADNSLTEISAGWNIDNAINAHFSPDGTRLVFMGDAAGEPRDWDIFLWEVNSPDAPRNLTQGSGLREEDPKFSPDGSKIVFKQGFWDNGLGTFSFDIKEMDLNGVIINSVTSDGGANEESMPYYTPNGQQIMYARGVGVNSDLYRINLDGSGNQALQALANVQEYYPITLDAERYLYPRWASAVNPNDQIFVGFFSGNPAISLPFNDPDNNYSDPYPCEGEFVLISSTRPGGAGGYDLYVGDANTGEIWSLSERNPAINTVQEELGSTYFVEKSSFSRGMMAGWNLVALPLEVENPGYEEIFPNAATNTLFGFNGSYVLEDTLLPGVGYWLNFPAPASVEVQGFALDTVTVALQPGWNLIAPPSCDVALDAVDDPGGIIVPGTLFGFNGAYFSGDTLRQGNAYWIRARTAGLISLICEKSP